MGSNIAIQSVENQGNECEADADGDARTGKVFAEGVTVK